MTNVDQFESAFRAAVKEPFEFAPVKLDSVLLVTDLGEDESEKLSARLRSFLKPVAFDLTWRILPGNAPRELEDLLKMVTERKPDLICTYRNLHSGAWKYPYSLGEHLDVLTQHTSVPVLVVPHPDRDRGSDSSFRHTKRVMAVTNHLVGDHRLVNYAAHFTAPGGTLHLAHIESDVGFARIIAAISKISTIDTDEASAKLFRQLLKQPADYIESCKLAFTTRKSPVTIQGVVEFGHRVSEIKRVADEREIDLVVFNTVDDGQLAMHGLAYSLAVELRDVPVLML